jgi:signal transduction histidine kinase
VGFHRSQRRVQTGRWCLETLRRHRALDTDGASTFSNITGLVETENGDLWLNSSAGIVHVTAAETHRAAEEPGYRIRPEIFDSRDGVQGDAARLRPMPTAVEGTDGRLWFSRNIGIYSISPGRLLRNPVPPPVLIQSLNAEDKSYSPAADLLLPLHTTSIRIDYVGLSLTMAEKVRYRYKLDGANANWQEAEGRRQAFYTNLSAGPHRFHVLAANNDGVWNETGATLDFVIAPTFFQTRWFIALCIVGGLGIISVLFLIRVRQVAARMRGRAQERLDERERIARELHDTLLQSTQGLILRFQSVANRIPAQDPTRDLLDKALNRADEVIAEGRDRVLDLRVPVDTLNDLPKAFATAGEDLALGRAVSFRTVVEGEPRALERLVKDEAYRIGREALLNAFQHAEAASIEVQTIFAESDFCVRVRDDGRGIGLSAPGARTRPGHWGLTGMRERAKTIGAQLNVWSKDAAGTELELKIPASIAYKESDLLPRWPRFRRLNQWMQCHKPEAQ